jgi:hypothetical protein
MASEHGKEQHMITSIAADAREREEQEDRFMSYSNFVPDNRVIV